jgi:uncharacterized iron-regulated membrane protein
MKLRLKRWLYLVHRWFGVAMCILFAMWFSTGIVMMYVEYPELTEEERLAKLAPIDFNAVALSADEALAASGLGRDVATITLSAIGARPAYRLRTDTGAAAVVYADDGSRFQGHAPASALAAVQHSGFVAEGELATYDGTIDVDQWTVSAVLDEHRPLHRVLIGDERGTVVYVSDTTGQVVRDTYRTERLWNWLGSTLHWIYPYQLRRHVNVWTNLQIFLSLASIVSVATGAVVGLLRLRLRRPYRGRDVSPYTGAAKWHHVLGLVSLLFLSTFTFSGLMSVTPWGLFDSASSEAEQVRRFMQGGEGETSAWTAVDRRALARGRAVKEAEWRRVAGLTHVVVSHAADDREVLIEGAPASDALPKVRARIEAAAPVLVRDASIVRAEIVTEYDDYYYSRHNRHRPLPAYRVEFDDAESTWFYVDWTTGAVVLRYTTAARVQRWLYNGLHSLDFTFLTSRGAVWDATVIALCGLGFVFAATAGVVGWRRVARAGHTSRTRINAGSLNS